jgi:hypothetical protein
VQATLANLKQAQKYFPTANTLAYSKKGKEHQKVL